MSPNSTIHLIRHAEGYHQLPRDHPHVNIHDPTLTPHGVAQSTHFSETFPYHAQTDLLCASPLRRTLQTSMIALAPEIERGLKIVAVPDAQEATDAPSDTGSDATTLRDAFGDAVDYGHLVGAWYAKTGVNATDISSLRERAKRLRIWLRGQDAEHVVLVTHGLFAHYLTGHIDDHGHQEGTFPLWTVDDPDADLAGEYWFNVMWRTFGFAEGDGGDADFVETEESKRRARTGETATQPQSLESSSIASS